MRTRVSRRTIVGYALVLVGFVGTACAVYLLRGRQENDSAAQDRPGIRDIFPTRDETGVPLDAHPVIAFSSEMAPESINESTVLLRDTAGAPVAATAAYDAETRRATLTPKSDLAASSEYSISVLGDASGARDKNGTPIPVNREWRFTTAAPPPGEGTEGPILLIAGAANPFSLYYKEILRNEGLNEFTVLYPGRLTPATLGRYEIVLLGDLPLSQSQTLVLSEWVRKGGRLIAMRPCPQLAGKLGLPARAGTFDNGYIAIDSRSAPGAGLVSEPIQFHGQADLYAPLSGKMVATLYHTANSATGSPAVAIYRVGRGMAAVFAYDLARSVVYTRQGNPAWSGIERDGIPPIRSDDLFYGNAARDPRPDWVDFGNIAIPQADMQQRLLANLVLLMTADRQPLPRLWYFPRGEKAVVIMTGDDHGHGGTSGRFRRFAAMSNSGCSVENWGCIRGTSNVFAHSIDGRDAVRLQAQGFEIALHVYTGCVDWPMQTVIGPHGESQRTMLRSAANSLYDRQLKVFSATYPHLHPPVTNRIDCITWGDFDTQPQVEFDHRIRFDENYYYWPPKWVRNRPGLFTGSGMPMRFATRDGNPIDVYQATTQITDESGQNIPATIEALLANALGPRQFYAALTVNMHTDHPESVGADAIVASAQAHRVPVVTAVQMLHWLDGRNASSFQNLRWAGHTLEFTLLVGAGANGLQVMLPVFERFGTLANVTIAGAPVQYQKQVRMGMEYACFAGRPGRYTATYTASGSD